MSSLALVICKFWVKTVPTFWKKKISLRLEVAIKCTLLFVFCWVTSVSKYSSETVTVRMAVAKLSLLVDSGDSIIFGRGWWWWNNGWFWVVVNHGGETVAGREWWQWNCDRWWEVVSSIKFMAGRGWLWMFVAGCGWSWVVPRFNNAPLEELFAMHKKLRWNDSHVFPVSNLPLFRNL